MTATRLGRFLLVAAVALMLLLRTAAAQAEARVAPEAQYSVPSSLVRVGSEAITFSTLGSEVSYLAGLGWTTGWELPPPVVGAAGTVAVSSEVAALLRLPRLAQLRTGLDGSSTRLVFDLADVDLGRLNAVERAALRQAALLEPGRTLVWTLPAMALPSAPLLDRDGLQVRVAHDRDSTRVELAASGAQARSFPLEDPSRLVVDLVPLSPGGNVSDGAAEPIGPEPVASEPVDLAAGVTYRRLRAPGVDGLTTVHLVELDPETVQLRVVGRSGEGRTVAGWAEGAIAGINAGYFHPDTFTAIGLRRIAGTMLSWPSRSRAVVGFGSAGAVVARAGVRAQVDVGGVRVVDVRIDGDGPLAWSAEPGDRVGSPRTGVVVLGPGGTVIRNKIGPQVVPLGGSALAYDAEFRPLALVEPGQHVSVRARLLPDELERTDWAVEAGPLLVQDGGSAFEPELEGFARGVRILDEPTQQAALGVRRDGTVLFVVAERMIAEDLVQLFLELKADAALRLDSGSSATLVADGRTVNRLLSRAVESAIVAVPNTTAEQPR